VRAGGTLWIVPPARAVWAPAGIEHEIRALGDFAMRTLYFPVAMTTGLPGECCALEVPPLLRELVLELVERCPVDDADEPGMRLAEVAIDRIAEARTLPLQLPLPHDPRALRLADMLRNDPSSQADLAELARSAGLQLGARGGIAVDPGCRTSDPDIYAIGECACLDGRVHGLVAPGYAMAEVVADRLLGGSATFPGADTSTKLKLLGVDVASFGDAHARTEGALEVVFKDAVAGWGGAPSKNSRRLAMSFATGTRMAESRLPSRSQLA